METIDNREPGSEYIHTERNRAFFDTKTHPLPHQMLIGEVFIQKEGPTICTGINPHIQRPLWESQKSLPKGHNIVNIDGDEQYKIFQRNNLHKG